MAGRELAAIVVGTTDLGEADRWVQLLTAEEGVLRAVARHARASRRRFGGTLDPGTEVLAQVGRARGGNGGWVLHDASRVRGPDVARTEYERIAMLGYGCEVAAALAVEAQANPKQFGLLRAWLGLLEGPRVPTNAARCAFEAKALTFAGFAPSLARCATCGEPIDAPAVFDAESGGAVHGRCGGGASVSVDALLELEALRRTPMAQTLDHTVALAHPWLLSDFVQHQIGRALASRALLATA